MSTLTPVCDTCFHQNACGDIDAEGRMYEVKEPSDCDHYFPLQDMPTIAYLCDGQACDECHDYCNHTTNIKHAKNFKDIDGFSKYMEHSIEGEMYEM